MSWSRLSHGALLRVNTAGNGHCAAAMTLDSKTSADHATVLHEMLSCCRLVVGTVNFEQLQRQKSALCKQQLSFPPLQRRLTACGQGLG